MVDEDFVMCREKRQFILGAAIALLAAGAGGAAVAGDTLVAGVVGSVAGAGFGLDFATYNSLKSPAFGTAATQLDCIVRQTLPTEATLKDVHKTFKEFNDAVSHLTACKSKGDISAQYLYIAEQQVALRQEQYADKQVGSFGMNVYAAVRSTQITAFAGSQNGVITPSQIMQAVQSMNLCVPGLPTAAAAPKAQGAPRAVACDIQLHTAEDKAVAFHAALMGFQLPDPLFQQCLAVSSNSGANGNGPSSGNSKTGSGGPQSGGPQAGAPQGGGLQNNGGQNASMPQPLSVQPVTNNNLCIDNSNGGAGATLQVTGGTPPYYFSALGDANGVIVSAPEVRLGPNGKGGRVMVADQGGSQAIVYVAPPPRGSPCPTPVPPVAAGH